jgi:2-keto-3-deoxy-L-rhamnonate aldolase RhmA
MKENSIRRAVREGRAALGTGLKEFASRGVPWIIEASGFDYCAIDHEHGAFDRKRSPTWRAGSRRRTSPPSCGSTNRSRI